MKLIVIGITDNPRPQISSEALSCIKKGKVFSGGRRHHEIMASLLPDDAQWIDITVPLDAVFNQYKVLDTDIIVFASGDPLFFGIANTLRREIPEAEMLLFPTFNSLQMLAHRLLMPYHDMRVVSLTGRPWHEFDKALIERESMIGLLTDREHTPAAIARRMLEYDYTYYDMYVGEHLGNDEEERIVKLSLEDAARQDFRYPNCIILTRNALYDEKPFGIPDADFALLDGREKMITKMPIRLMTLQALDLARRYTLWDIGACTGSVSIEARQLFPHLHIEAFEIRPECEAIIHENMRRHRSPGIGIHIGDFLTMECDSVALPDAVFIGGHGGQLQAIMEKVLHYLSPGGIIVMNSVATSHVPNDSRQLWDEACQQLGITQEQPLHIQLNDYNPITILKASKTYR